MYTMYTIRIHTHYHLLWYAICLFKVRSNLQEPEGTALHCIELYRRRGSAGEGGEDPTKEPGYCWFSSLQ